MPPSNKLRYSQPDTAEMTMPTGMTMLVMTMEVVTMMATAMAMVMAMAMAMPLPMQLCLQINGHYVLCQEYKFGKGDRKAARFFTVEGRGWSNTPTIEKRWVEQNCWTNSRWAPCYKAIWWSSTLAGLRVGVTIFVHDSNSIELPIQIMHSLDVLMSLWSYHCLVIVITPEETSEKPRGRTLLPMPSQNLLVWCCWSCLCVGSCSGNTIVFVMYQAYKVELKSGIFSVYHHSMKHCIHHCASSQ